MINQSFTSFIWAASLTNVFFALVIHHIWKWDGELELSLRLTLKRTTWWICKRKSLLKCQTCIVNDIKEHIVACLYLCWLDVVKN